MDSTFASTMTYESTPRQRLCLSGVAVVMFIFLYRLPHFGTEAMAVHQAIVEALLSGNNWGRQALVGSLDYPILPSLGLLAAELLGRALSLSGPKLLLAFAQTWCLLYLFRAILRQRGWLFAPAGLLLALLLPQLRHSFLLLDPNWVSAIPLASIFFHLVIWQSERGLRDLILTGVNCGLLALCGLFPAILGACIIVCFYFAARHHPSNEPLPVAPGSTATISSGLRSLLWAPWAYGLFLWLLWNWLIMSDPFFSLRDLFARAGSTLASSLNVQFSQSFPIVAALLIPLALVACCSRQKGVARSLLPAAVLIPLLAMLAAALGMPPTGLLPLATILTLTTLLLIGMTSFPNRNMQIATYATGVLILILCIFGPSPATTSTRATAGTPAPSRQEILDFIDQFWPDSRIVLYGIRLPAVYPDPHEKRFLARVDYQETDFLRQSEDEQLHLLVPPSDGVYYPAEKSPLAEIHSHGKPWLFLEKQWPNQWQLWRSVVPAQNESRLDFLR